MYGNNKEFTHRTALIAIRDLNNLIDSMGSVFGTLDPSNTMFKSLCSDYQGEGMSYNLHIEPGKDYGNLRVSFRGENIIDQEVDLDRNGNLKSQEIRYTSNGIYDLIQHLEDNYVE